MTVPVATNNGKGIVGTVRREFFVSKEDVFAMALSSRKKAVSYVAATTDKSKASLTVRGKYYGRRISSDRSEWAFASCSRNPKTGELEARQLRPSYFARG